MTYLYWGSGNPCAGHSSPKLVPTSFMARTMSTLATRGGEWPTASEGVSKARGLVPMCRGRRGFWIGLISFHASPKMNVLSLRARGS